jgi:hypothetical protein
MAWKLIPLFLFYYYEFKVITVRNNTLAGGNKSDALCLASVLCRPYHFYVAFHYVLTYFTSWFTYKITYSYHIEFAVKKILKIVWIFTKRNASQIIMRIMYGFCNCKYLGCYSWLSETIPDLELHIEPSQNVHRCVRENGFFPVTACRRLKARLGYVVEAMQRILLT